ncbi:MAG: YwaF family protein [Clostridia bacterium]|nr:YwaF family protein [Clostridia bacterium]
MEKKFFYDNFDSSQICGILSLGHIFTVILFAALSVLSIYFLKRLNGKQSKRFMLIVAISVTFMEIVKISLRIAKNQACDSWVPLYYCSLFIFAMWFTLAKNPKIQTIGYSYIGMGAILAAPLNILYPSTSLAIFPIWHPASVHSFLYHLIMFVTGIFILIKKIYIPKKEHSIVYFVFIFIACIPSVILNETVGTNCMFLANAFGLPILGTLQSSQPIIYMLLVFIAQSIIIFWASFGAYKLINHIQTGEKQMEIKYTLPTIKPETLKFYTYTNEELLKETPKAIVLDFHGLGMTAMRKEPNEFETECAKHGILTLFPYYGPWSWMNLTSVKFVDEIVKAVCEKYSLDVNSVPIISTGGSMGGHSALNYTKYAKVTPKACFTNCPVCDFKFHATEREDLPRTAYLAFSDYDCGFEKAIEMHSAYHMASQMPDIPYYIVHGTRDSAVNKEAHSDRFVAEMRRYGKNVTYIEVEGMEHCDLDSYPEVKKNYFDAIIKSALE